MYNVINDSCPPSCSITFRGLKGVHLLDCFVFAFAVVNIAADYMGTENSVKRPDLHCVSKKRPTFDML